MFREGKTPKKHYFRYKVRDNKNKTRLGRATATEADQVKKLLESRGYKVLSVEEEKKVAHALGFGKVPARDRSIMYRELATMLRSGVGITQAIEIVGETPNKRLRKVLKQISVTLENGFPLSAAMASYPKTFPVVETGVVKAGEATGNLSKVLDELSKTTGRSADFVGKVRGAMIYPAFIVAVMTIVGVVILTKVIPPIKEIFDSTGTELPLTTRTLIVFTDFVIHQWLWLIIGIIVFGILVKLFLTTKPGRNFGSWIGLSFPVFGSLNQQVYLARFNRTLALLITSGVSIIESVDIITESTSNQIFLKSLRELRRALEQGSAISTSMQNNRYFPRLMTQLLYVGQQSGDLGGSATTLADYFEAEVDAKLRTFSALIEPFIIVLLGVAVAFVILSVLQPIYNLTGTF